MKYTYFLCALLSFIFVSCDDGHVDDPTYDNTTDSYTVKITGTFQRLKTWSGKYSVAAACYAENDDYSLIQKVLPADTNDSTTVTMILSNVPVKAKSVEIAVVGTLRDRVATLYAYDIPSNQRYNDTITIDVGTLDVGMFGAINKFIFQNTSINCARCHASASGTARLDLTEKNAYSALVGVNAYKDSTSLRVKPFDADNSLLYRTLCNDVKEIRYNHAGLLADYQSFLEIIKFWINSGAER